mmetsp:Transcript_26805/g.42964  ORF Transcript_26805/g.42964 Transcript_26805/m.42964 type:complete len:307 (+) Transcript_26805:252-1172(+)
MPIMDRFSDISKSKEKDDDDGGDVEMGEGGGGKSRSPFMKEFFAKVEQIKRNMDQIKKNMVQLEKKHGTALTAVSSTKSNKQQEEIEDMMDQTTTLIKAVKESLKELDTEAKAHRKKSKGDAEDRTRQNMYNTLVKKFISLVQEYQEMQNNFKNKYRDRVGRQLKVVKPDATLDEIEELIDSGGDKNIFTQQMLGEKSTQAARNALADIQDKHKDIVRLEQSIVELHQLFVDMSVLVETQGEMLDQIELHVQQAHQYVDKGVKQLEKAKESQKSARKRMCCIVCCCVIFLMLVVGGVFGAVAPSFA